MRATGMVRNIDRLGRIVIPMEVRKTYGLGDKQAMEFFTDDGNVILRKYGLVAFFAGTQMNQLFSRKISCAKPA